MVTEVTCCNNSRQCLIIINCNWDQLTNSAKGSQVLREQQPGEPQDTAVAPRRSLCPASCPSGCRPGVVSLVPTRLIFLSSGGHSLTFSHQDLWGKSACACPKQSRKFPPSDCPFQPWAREVNESPERTAGHWPQKGLVGEVVANSSSNPAALLRWQLQSLTPHTPRPRPQI